MPTRLDIQLPLWRGDTLFIPFELHSNGDPMPLGGSTVVFTLKLDPTAPDEDADFMYSQEIHPLDALGGTGKHIVRIERTALTDLELAKYTYQFKVIQPSVPEDIETTYVWGKISLGDS